MEKEAKRNLNVKEKSAKWSKLFATVSIFISIIALVVAIIFYASNMKNDVVLNVATVSTSIAVLASGLSSIIMRQIQLKRIRATKLTVFVSYCDKDKDSVSSFLSLLKRTSLRTMGETIHVMDANLIPYGESIENATKEYLNRSSLALVFVSDGYTKDKRCTKEFKTIIENEDRVIPVVLDTVENLSKLPRDLSDIKALSVTTIKENQESDSKNSTSEELNNQVQLLAEMIKGNSDLSYASVS